MGEALLSRLLSNKSYSPEAVLVSEPQAQRRAVLAQQYGIQVTAENQDLIAAPILLLAIKPQVFDAVVNQLESDQLGGDLFDQAMGHVLHHHGLLSVGSRSPFNQTAPCQRLQCLQQTGARHHRPNIHSQFRQ
ncbi:NAD(P)-binding domain-containing protein [Leptolyngbya sp. 7M]|uniref:pyrroline-5-carboxylate reductase family protein n=1 Tax=Leptolyngbya sp. 7M TaxID=2812896 RepID=UPI0028F4110C